MDRIIKVGIIGCGGIANKKHMPSLAKVAGCEMVAFCDIIEERALAARERFGTPDARVYTDYKEMLAKEGEIEVIHVCTPNRHHSPITVAALEAGKHVMCEKPMATSTADAEKMLEAARRTGKLLTIGYQCRFRDDAMYLKGEAEADTFGEVYYAKATALRRRAVPNWGVFLNEDEQGGGPLIDIGTHALDLTLWLMNNYKPKYCVGSVYHKLNSDTDQGNAYGSWDPEKFTVEDSAFGFVVMENGATILIESSWALNMLDTREAVCTLCGTKAGCDMTDGARINGVKGDRQYVTVPDLTRGGRAMGLNPGEPTGEREIRSFIDTVRRGGELKINSTPEQALTVTKILEGIYKSAKSGTVYNF